ncbi:sushi domain-containing protein 2-like [Saccoglossus kowalevskii]
MAEDTRVVSIYPTSGSMLGGESVQVHGPCLNNIDRLRCKFGDYETRGTLVASKVMCNTPIFYEAGRVEFRLSLDDGDTYDDYRGIFTVVSPEYVEPSIQRINSPNWHLSHETDVTITWDMTSIEAIQLHVFIFGYVENGGSVSLEMAERITATPIDNTGSYTFAKQQQQYADFHIGAIRIVDANSSLSGYPRSLWSDIHNLQWKYEAESVQFCREWLSSPNEQDTSFLDDLLPCPCTRQQARVDIGRYEPHPRCNDDSSDIINCHLKPAAVHCIRVNEPSGNGAGQECCYNNDGNLVDGSDGNSGGTSHRYHHGGVSPYKSPGKVPYLSHYLADLLPWEHCCLYQQSDTMCFDYYDKRPSDGCQQYQPPRPSGGIGDPHIHTLDGTPYTFNGQGEFSLMKTTGNSFSMQGRMQPLTADSQATVFTAVVMKAASTDTVQIEVNNRGDLVAWIASLSDGSWKTVNFEERGSWPFTGVTVTKDQLPETESITITAVFVTSGISVQFTASSGIMMMSFVLIAPQTLMSNTQGLLGTWNNDPDDDFTRPDGVYISTTLSLHDIHYHFGMHCKYVSPSAWS